MRIVSDFEIGILDIDDEQRGVIRIQLNIVGDFGSIVVKRTVCSLPVTHQGSSRRLAHRRRPPSLPE